MERNIIKDQIEKLKDQIKILKTLFYLPLKLTGIKRIREKYFINKKGNRVIIFEELTFLTRVIKAIDKILLLLINISLWILFLICCVGGLKLLINPKN